MLNQDDGSGLPKRAFEEALKVVRSRRQQNFQSWRVGEPVIKSMRMVSTGAAHRSHGATNDDWSFDLSIRHVGNVGGLLDNLRDGFESEVKEDFVDNGA